MRKKITITIICAVVVLTAFVSLAPSVYSYRPGSLLPPVVIRDHHGPPQEWIAALVEREGGLPKTDAHLTCYTVALYDCDIGLAEPVDVHPVESWEIERITLNGGWLLPELLKGEMAYTIEVDFRVHYSDGDTALLRWDTWRYGWCFGPWAIDSGGGPTGDIFLISLDTS